ncbi:CLUMA_CG008560, isoform A [Clunio marinus]|uniref:CLUMA_CG008560, isoform A n=1 Tax=Clunio marinus TaxID=568069 RepID=A0A1J1I5R1_9DIPT|nr:CLUMA_CG008560, isoform A [Clunio marinus]
MSLIQVEILKYEEQDQFNEENGFIDYIPEEAICEEYEYIEVEDPENGKIEYISNILNPKIIGSKSDNETKDKTIFLKLNTDLYFQNKREKKFSCSSRKCKKDNISFDTQEELDQHNVFHLEQIVANECPICNKILANQMKLNIHMETRHVPKTFFCDNCGKTFRSKDNLRLHMSHHRKHFIVECKACHKSYKSMQSLRYHLRQHFEHHQCESCGKVFEHKKLLLGHIASKHNQELMLQCRFCSRMFSRNDVREAHERDIHKNGQIGSHFKCNECECAFDFRDELMSHKILNHYSGIIHTCEECGKNFKKNSLLELHMQSHKEKSIQCDVCEMMFTFVTGLAKHKKLGRCKGPAKAVNTLSKEEIAIIARNQLEEITVNHNRKVPEVDLFSDMTKEEPEKPKDPPKNKKKPGRKRKIVSIQGKNIEIESYRFVDGHQIEKMETKKPIVKVELQKNIGAVHIKSENSAETITSSSGRIIKRKLPLLFTYSPFKPINLTKKPNIPYECDKCGMTLDTKSRLLSHLNSHVRGQKYKCEKCEKSFCNMMSMKKHCAAIHREANPFKEKRFKCDKCPKRYLTEFLLGQHKLSHLNLKNQKCNQCSFATNTIYDLKNHIKRIHQSVKSFPCTELNCGKSFKRRCDMENHKKSVHTTIKVYVKCPVCDVIILEKGLQSHMSNRHSEKGQNRPFECSICGKTERYESNLIRHVEAVHMPTDRGVTYHCPQCPQTFFRRRELTSHSFEHYTGVVHVCEECGNRYKSKKELTNHLYSHRCKEWPCTICNTVFQTKSGRAKHIKKHVNDSYDIRDPSDSNYIIEQEEVFID